MNDIPLIICLPFAYIFGLLDPLNAIVGVFLTLCDLIAMLVYLSYDDEVSIDAESIFASSQKRIEDNDEVKNRLLDDNNALTSRENQSHEGSKQEEVDDNEGEILITDNQNDGGNNAGDTIAFDVG